MNELTVGSILQRNVKMTPKIKKYFKIKKFTIGKNKYLMKIICSSQEYATELLQ